MARKSLTISLVIPAYNEDNHLGECLASITKQSQLPDEIIVIDNNSTDQTRRIAEQFFNVRIIEEKKQGIVHARNRGFDSTKSEIIARIDADSILPTDWIENVKNFYSKETSDNNAWTCGVDFYNVPFPWFISSVYNYLIFRFNKLMTGQETLWGSGMAILSNHWRLVRQSVCDRTDIHEDLDLAMHLHDKGIKIHVDSSIKVGARLRSIHSSMRDLWSYLKWWPNTLKVHNKKTWPIVWLIGVLMMFVLALILNLAERIVGVYNLLED